MFDLDNTLYPPATRIFAEIDHRMTTFVAELLSIGREEARAVQKDLFHAHGTTLSGLMRDHDIDPHAYLEFVHDIDVSGIAPDGALADLLAGLPGRRLIYTNGSVAHAARITGRLGIDHLFDGVFDIVAADFVPKPSQSAFERFLATHGVAPERAIFFDDMAHNLQPAHALGLTTVWIDAPNDWSRPGGHGDHVHHRAVSLKDFLAAVHDTLPPKTGLQKTGNAP